VYEIDFIFRNPPLPAVPADSQGLAFAALMRADPFNEVSRLIYADWVEEHGDMERAKLLRKCRIPLTAQDMHAARCLRHCRFIPGSTPKQFAHSTYKRLDAQPIPSMTPKGYAFLWRLVWSWRKQLPGNVVALSPLFGKDDKHSDTPKALLVD